MDTLSPSLLHTPRTPLLAAHPVGRPMPYYISQSSHPTSPPPSRAMMATRNHKDAMFVDMENNVASLTPLHHSLDTRMLFVISSVMSAVLLLVLSGTVWLVSYQ